MSQKGRWPIISFIPPILLGLSIALHFVTIVLYTRLPLSFAAFTVFPIWVWGGIGLLLASIPFIFSRTRFALFAVIVWTFTILLVSDEAQSVGRFGVEPITKNESKEYADSKVLRVITLNCARNADPIIAMKNLEPDIIFLQEIPHAYKIKRIIETFFNGQGDYRYNARKGCAIIARGKLHSNLNIPKFRSQQLAVELPNGRNLQLLNIHLQSAATNLELYKRSCWREHSHNRRLRQTELAYALAVLKQKTAYPRYPTIIAGDFNSSVNDPVYRLLEPDFTNAFTQVGTGWPNTYHRSLPLLRIDHIYSSSKLVPVRSTVFGVDNSDHRMLVADFVFRN